MRKHTSGKPKQLLICDSLPSLSLVILYLAIYSIPQAKTQVKHFAQNIINIFIVFVNTLFVIFAALLQLPIQNLICLFTVQIFFAFAVSILTNTKIVSKVIDKYSLTGYNQNSNSDGR